MVVPAVACRRLQIDRRPDFDVGDERIREVVGQHRHDPLPHAVERQRLADRIRPSAEILAPQALADHDDTGIGALVDPIEGLTDDRLDAEHAKVVGADPQRRDALRFHAIGEVRSLGGVGVDRREIDRRALVAEGEHRRTRQVVVFAAVELVQTDEPIGGWIGKWCEHHRVQHAEHGGVGAEPERERQDDGGGELRRRAERSHRIGEVLSQAVHSSLLSLCRRPGDRCRDFDERTPGKVGGLSPASARSDLPPGRKVIKDVSFAFALHLLVEVPHEQRPPNFESVHLLGGQVSFSRPVAAALCSTPAADRAQCGAPDEAVGVLQLLPGTKCPGMVDDPDGRVCGDEEIVPNRVQGPEEEPCRGRC